MLTKAMYIERRGASLRALDTEINRLTDYADRADDDVALEYYEAIQGLETSRDRAAKMLLKLGSIDAEVVANADDMRDMERYWRELRNAVVNAISTTGSDQVES
jgi:chromosome condensin MukBEF ATPase and DNA-binding subunit MukB